VVSGEMAAWMPRKVVGGVLCPASRMTVGLPLPLHERYIERSPMS